MSLVGPENPEFHMELCLGPKNPEICVSLVFMKAIKFAFLLHSFSIVN